ncbi:uncharacterized protein LOC141626797 [Silene latifolia]|uniref:uncharacterized protein LOC141626797 n=1 Tax=Silene latifolia TaxID=37657 RepID=UPI003D76FF0C
MNSIQYLWSRKSQKTTSSSSPLSLEPQNLPNQEEQINDEQISEGESDNPSIQEGNQSEHEGNSPTQEGNQSEEYNVLPLDPPHDPGNRKPISSYRVNDRDALRRIYIGKGPCRPRPNGEFPQTFQGNKMRRFKVLWYDKYDWLEYSEENNAAFCFCCYLFKEPSSIPKANVFEIGGFKNWKNALDRFKKYVGKGTSSSHKVAKQKYESFINKKESIIEIVEKVSDEAKSLYKCRLLRSLSCLRFLLRQGLAFREHNEKAKSSNKGNFLELLDWLVQNSESVAKVVLAKSPENHQVTCPTIQKELIKCCAQETTKLIIEDLNGDYFGLLADESSDVSHKEELAICLRYVNKDGKLCERFLGIVHVKNTTSLTLFEKIKKLLDGHSLSMSNIRGQGYDGASNMRGEFNGLQSLIMRDNPCAYYVHCFAHQLQLTLVAVAKENKDCAKFFQNLGIVLNNIGYSCKRLEMVRDIQSDKVLEALASGEIESGKGLNQELGLSRPGETRWGSHFKSIVRVMFLYGTLIRVFEIISKGAKSVDDHAKAEIGIDHLESFEFVFMLHLMKVVYGYTNSLCEALQRKDQDIVNAMTILDLTKEHLTKFRNDGWDQFLQTVSNFCAKHNIEVPNMDDFYAPPGRSRRRLVNELNLQRFRIDMFIGVLDKQVHELDSRFDVRSMEMLMCMACLSPTDVFASFDKDKLVRLAKFYPNEFNDTEITLLEFELDIFESDMLRDSRFHLIKSLGELSIMLVETKKHISYSRVYLLLKLVLTLPVATASVERVFSSMKYVKNYLRNSMSDELLDNCLVTYIERDFFSQVSDDDVIRRFQDMNPRRMALDFS